MPGASPAEVKMMPFYKCPDCGARAEEHVPHYCKQPATRSAAQVLADAAPDLLDACKSALDFLTRAERDLAHRGESSAQRDKLAAAIAKAGG